MEAWDSVRPRAELVLAWSSQALAAGSLAALAAEFDGSRAWWAAPLMFVPVYALVVQVLARQIFRRMPFAILSRLWWLAGFAGVLWAPLARPVARALRRVKPDPLPQPPAAEELMALAERTEGISALEQSMLRSVLDFRRLTAGGLALPVDDFPNVEADRTLGSVLSDRKLAEARHTLVLDGAGAPLGVMSCAAAALSGASSARAQSFARPLLSFPADLPAWKALAALRRSPTPVAEVRDEETGRLAGVLSDQSAVARLLGQAV
jgi:CBS domain containing-hemolysin-like protein